jgi:hypothetical protein
VATLRATDPDTLGHLTYSLVSGDEGHFQLDTADTGVLRLREALDRETRDTYRLQVRASDGVQHTDTMITIKVTSLLPTTLLASYSPSDPPPHAHSSPPSFLYPLLLLLIPLLCSVVCCEFHLVLSTTTFLLSAFALGVYA